MSQHTLENTLRPYASYNEDGINLLPDEVLAMVLEQVHELAKGGIDFCAEEFSSQHKVQTHLCRCTRTGQAIARESAIQEGRSELPDPLDICIKQL